MNKNFQIIINFLEKWNILTLLILIKEISVLITFFLEK